MPNLPELKRRILEESHRSSLSIHLGATKMYQDLMEIFWWPGMKKDVVEFVYSCFISMDFVVGFPRTTKKVIRFG